MKEKLDLKTLSIKPRKTEKELTIFYREGTTDEKVIPEVLKTNVYQSKKNDFYIESKDRWLDLGGNIGTFLLLCLAVRVQFVISFEPEPENFSILKKVDRGVRVPQSEDSAVLTDKLSLSIFLITELLCKTFTLVFSLISFYCQDISYCGIYGPVSN